MNAQLFILQADAAATRADWREASNLLIKALANMDPDDGARPQIKLRMQEFADKAATKEAQKALSTAELRRLAHEAAGALNWEEAAALMAQAIHKHPGPKASLLTQADKSNMAAVLSSWQLAAVREQQPPARSESYTIRISDEQRAILVAALNDRVAMRDVSPETETLRALLEDLPNQDNPIGTMHGFVL